MIRANTIRKDQIHRFMYLLIAVVTEWDNRGSLNRVSLKSGCIDSKDSMASIKYYALSILQRNVSFYLVSSSFRVN